MIFNNKKELLKLFSQDKKIAQNQIELSLKNWKDNGFKENVLLSLLLKKNTNIHWEKSKNIIGYFDIHLVWSNSVIRSEINIKKKEVVIGLEGIKNFYSNISTVKPDLSHPDILNCFNKTAEEYGFKKLKIDLKEQIETNILDPFGGICGFTKKKEKEILNKHKNEALEIINYSLEIFETHHERKSIICKSQKFKCFEVLDNSKFLVNLYWNKKVIKSSINKGNDVIKTLKKYKGIVESFNVKRPNVNNSVIKKMYDISLVN